MLTVDGMATALARFGDGVDRPPSAILPHEHATPTLDELYALALTAQAERRADVYAVAWGEGRPYALRVRCGERRDGLLALVVQRRSRPHRPDDAEGRVVTGRRVDEVTGEVLDPGRVLELVLQLPVFDVIAAKKRAVLRETDPKRGRYAAAPRRRTRIAAITIR